MSRSLQCHHLKKIEMGLSPRYYIPSFMEINLPVPEMIFEGFLPYMGVAHLVQIDTVVSEKIQFDLLYVHNLGPRSKMTLAFNTHISSYIQLDVCSY